MRRNGVSTAATRAGVRLNSLAMMLGECSIVRYCFEGWQVAKGEAGVGLDRKRTGARGVAILASGYIACFMARARKLEDCLEALSSLRNDPAAHATRAELAKYLAHKSNAVVAKAAKLSGDFDLHDLRPQLVA